MKAHVLLRVSAVSVQKAPELNVALIGPSRAPMASAAQLFTVLVVYMLRSIMIVANYGNAWVD